MKCHGSLAHDVFQKGKIMKKSILAASLTAALCFLASNSVSAEVISSSQTLTPNDSQIGEVAYTATGTDTFSGANQNIDFTITGDWSGLFEANGSDKSWDISNFNNLTLQFSNPNLQSGTNGLGALGQASIYLHDIENISITSSQRAVVNGWDAVAVHANNGSVVMRDVGNVTISSPNHGNAVMVQGNHGALDINAKGDITIESRDTSVLVGLIANTSASSVSSISMEARTISITSNSGVALQAYDMNSSLTGPNQGSTNIQLVARDSIALQASDAAILQARLIGVGSGSAVTIQAPIVDIHGDAGAIATYQGANSQVANDLTIDAQTVNLTSSGEASQVFANPISFATVDLAENANVNFVNTTDNTRPQINIAASAGDSVNVSQAANLSFTNADVNVAQGNVTGEGTVVLNDTTLNLAENVTMSMDTVKGEGAQVVFNTARENAVQITHADKNVAVLASGDLNDRYGEEALGFINADNATTGAQAGKVRGAIVEQADGSHVVEQNTAMTALEQMNASTLVQFRLENNRLSQRLGEVRDNLNKAGGWARVYGAKSRLSDSIDSTIKTNSIQVGADATIGNNWIVGGAFSYTNMDADFSNGNGESDSYMLSAYASGFFDCGGYVDIIGRVGRLSTDLNASSGPSVEAFDGSYDNTAFGLSTEVGYHWKLSDVFFIEPQAELAYGYVLGDDYTSSNDVKVKQDDFQSLVGRLGTRLGAAFPKDAGIIYAHASVNHDFLGDNDFTAQAAGMTSAMKFSNDLDETWVSYGIGLQLNPSKNFYVYGSLDRATGSDYAESYHYSVGARYVF